MTIEIRVSAHVSERSFTSKKDGKSFVFRDQVCGMKLANGFEQQFAVPLAKDQPAYAAGIYELCEESFGFESKYADQLPKLCIARVVLRRVDAKAAPQAKAA